LSKRGKKPVCGSFVCAKIGRAPDAKGYKDRRIPLGGGDGSEISEEKRGSEYALEASSHVEALKQRRKNREEGIVSMKGREGLTAIRKKGSARRANAKWNTGKTLGIVALLSEGGVTLRNLKLKKRKP